MAFTYTQNPSTNNLDFVRWRVGDTNSADQLQSDSEINAALAIWGDRHSAAAGVAEAIAAGFARRIDTTQGKLSLKLSQKYDHYAKLADEIRKEGASLLAATPWMAAHSISAKDDYEEDTDRVTPSFALGMTDTVDQGIPEPSTGI